MLFISDREEAVFTISGTNQNHMIKINSGSTNELILPYISNDKKLDPGKNICLCFSPERIDPGNKTLPIMTKFEKTQFKNLQSIKE